MAQAQFSLPLTVLPAVATPVGLVVAYGFRDDKSSKVARSIGNDFPGMLQDVLWSPEGRSGNCLLFNGKTSRVVVADQPEVPQPALRLTTGMTLSAWVKPAVVTGFWRDVIMKGNDDYYLMAGSLSGLPAAGGTFAGGPLFGPAPLLVNVWTHLAATYSSQTLRLYVNGAQVASKTRTQPIQTSVSPLTIGSDPFYGQHFAGLMNDVRIYNRALTSAEIRADMDTPVGGQTLPKPPDTAAPVVVSHSPPAGAVNVAPNAVITVTFDESMNSATITSDTIILRDPAGNVVPVIVSYDAATKTATLTPVQPLGNAPLGFR